MRRGPPCLQGEEGDRIALLASTPCASDAMGVVLDAVGHVVVDDAGHILDINTAPSHICGHQHRVLALLEPCQACLTLILQHGSWSSAGRLHISNHLKLSPSCRLEKCTACPCEFAVQRTVSDRWLSDRSLSCSPHSGNSALHRPYAQAALCASMGACVDVRSLACVLPPCSTVQLKPSWSSWRETASQWFLVFTKTMTRFSSTRSR